MVQLSAITAPFFRSPDDLGRFTRVTADVMPDDYRSLLAHDDHMTVTVEAFHDCRVDVRVLREHRDGDFYSRASVLACQSTGRVVQFGIMRINLAGLAQKVRADIESGSIPLGRALIRHNVLRHVELLELWRVAPTLLLRDQLELVGDASLYARTARIVVEGRPAVELLEIPRA